MAISGSAAPRVRPGVVTAAMISLYVLAGLQLLGVVLQLVTMGPIVDAVRDYGAEVGDTANGDAAATVFQIFAYVFIALGLLFAVGFGVLGLFTGRGNNPARIVAWVLLGVALCCGAASLVSLAAGSFGPSGQQQGNIDPEEMQRRIEAAVPGWSTSVETVRILLGVVLALAAVILLALPAANDYFRKQTEPVWEPPLPGATFPAPGAAEAGAPGTPAPGTPAPGQPGAPGAAGPSDPGAGGTPPSLTKDDD